MTSNDGILKNIRDILRILLCIEVYGSRCVLMGCTSMKYYVYKVTIK